MKIQKQLLTGALLAILVLSTLPFAGCAKKNPEPGYKKAFYSAQLIYGIDTLGDIFEILKNGNVLQVPGAKAAIDFTDRGLTAADEIVSLIEQGLATGNFDKVRQVIAGVKAAVANGVIRFTDQRANEIYNNVIGTIEITINLVEAARANNQPEVERLEAQRAQKAKALRQTTRQVIPWYQNALVRTTAMITEIATLSPLNAPEIWAAVHARSESAHRKNQTRLSTW